MAGKLARGITLLHEHVGHGVHATRGDVVTYNVRMFLHRGDEITFDADIIERAAAHVTTRVVDGIELIDHVIVLGKRQAIAGIELALLGMQQGGYREVTIAPHLAYRDVGIPGRIPPDALLRAQLWVRDLQASR